MNKTFYYICALLVSVLFISSCSKRIGKPKISLRRIRSKNVSGTPTKKVDTLLRQLDQKFVELQGWKSKVDINRRREEEALLKIREEISQLKDQISLSLKTKNDQSNNYYRPQNNESLLSRETSSMSGPDGSSSLDTSFYSKVPLKSYKSNKIPEVAKFVPQSINPSKKNNSKSLTVKAPPFLRKNSVSMNNYQPKDYSASDKGLATNYSKIQVTLKKGATVGRVLWIERRQDEKVLRIDIGTLAGLKKDSLVSIGGVGAGCSVWKVVSVRKYSSVIKRVPTSPVGGVKRGDTVYQVTRN